MKKKTFEGHFHIFANYLSQGLLHQNSVGILSLESLVETPADLLWEYGIKRVAIEHPFIELTL